jgi:DNA (cytosine-5)-methyltransferase 1
MSLVALDLFCGAGGLSLGLERAGFRVVGAIDSWPVAVDSYNLNFGHRAACCDLERMSGAEVRAKFGLGDLTLDLVVGGPPCQGFSIQRVGSDQDERNNLVLEFARLVAELRPRGFLMENVLGLVGNRGRELVRLLEESLRRAGYVVKMSRVNAADYGVPQTRRRVIFFGWLPSGSGPLSLPEPALTPARHKTVNDAIGDLAPPPADYSPAPGDPLHRRMRLSALNLERLRLIPPGGGMVDLPTELRVACHRNGADAIGHRYVYGRLAGDRPAGTITGRFDSFTRGKFAHPSDDRNITLREGARLQTFPDSFKFSGTQEDVAAQIGNAVPPSLAEAILTHVAACLEQPSDSDDTLVGQLPLLPQLART